MVISTKIKWTGVRMIVNLIEKLKGALYGMAIGDAMGAPVEGWAPEKIKEIFHKHDYMGFLPVTHTDDPSTGKGFGRITDDTLMAEALIRAYSKSKKHMDAYDYEAFMLPEITETVVWLPEKQKKIPIIERVWYPEKYPWLRFMSHSVDPRNAGVGNVVNCGLAMYFMPIGAVNAGDPLGAYSEAASFGLAQNESFAVESAATIAAVYAYAFSRESTIEEAINVGIDVAHDGTKKAIIAVVNAANVNDSLDNFIKKTRQAYLPYGRSFNIDINTDDKVNRFVEVNDKGRPSRVKTIEEVPVAFAAVKYGNGDFIKTLCAAVCYGRDCDSIASMALGVFGALFGINRIPEKLRNASDKANRRNYGKVSEDFYRIMLEIFEKDKIEFDKKNLIWNK